MDTFSLLAINMADLWKALEIMWKGVVAIFIVVALIIIVTKAVNKTCVSMDKKRAERKKEAEDQSGSDRSH